jgi:hypothetical protein
MTDNKPKEPYVYKLYDMQDKEHRTISAIFGVAGCNPTVRGISLDLAEQIVEWLKQIADLKKYNLKLLDENVDLHNQRNERNCQIAALAQRVKELEKEVKRHEKVYKGLKFMKKRGGNPTT